MEPSITCPVCGQTSYHPKDIEEGYCGRCHWWTGNSSPLSKPLISHAVISAAHMVCMLAHADQKRWDGSDYYLHPFGVADLVEANKGNEATIVAALLHDVVEDSDVTIEAIEKFFGPRVARIVFLVTKELGTPYKDFIATACTDPDAMLLKRCDIIHNLSTLPMNHGMNERYLNALEQIYNMACNV